MASELFGVAELHAKLQALASPNENAKVLRGSLLAAMNRVKKIARANIARISPGKTPLHRTYKGRFVSSGFASRSLVVVTRANRSKTSFSAVLGVKAEAFYAVQFFELGTAFIPRQPWLVPAFAASKNSSLSVLVDSLRSRMLKIARKKGATT